MSRQRKFLKFKGVGSTTAHTSLWFQILVGMPMQLHDLARDRRTIMQLKQVANNEVMHYLIPFLTLVCEDKGPAVGNSSQRPFDPPA